jgi:DNA polymerase-3 subunit epsilon
MVQSGFAVIDVETTGFIAGRDRIVELAVVHVDASGHITGKWDTLVNPGRDLGPQHIHHIDAADVLDAPSFDNIVPTLITLLSGRVIVAHNASFDIRFLTAELEHAGYHPGAKLSGLCTMQLASQFLPGSGRSLADCCSAYDIELDGAHRASVDALATAKLLGAYINDAPRWHGWNEYAAASNGDWQPHNGPDVPWHPRELGHVEPASFLERITLKLPEFAGPAEHRDYVALVDRCLLDRTLSVHEANDLVATAETLGISRATCESLHARYFTELAAVAWADGVLTTDEIDDLSQVGVLLSIAPETVLTAINTPDAALASPETPEVEHFTLHQGDLIVLTGDMNRDREAWNADLQALGYVPWAGVTKKVTLVVAADPDSLSGKARKARAYGIPIITEAALGTLLAHV